MTKTFDYICIYVAYISNLQIGTMVLTVSSVSMPMWRFNAIPNLNILCKCWYKTRLWFLSWTVNAESPVLSAPLQLPALLPPSFHSVYRRPWTTISSHSLRSIQQEHLQRDIAWCTCASTDNIAHKGQITPRCDALYEAKYECPWFTCSRLSSSKIRKPISALGPRYSPRTSLYWSAAWRRIYIGWWLSFGKQRVDSNVIIRCWGRKDATSILLRRVCFGEKTECYNDYPLICLDSYNPDIGTLPTLRKHPVVTCHKSPVRIFNHKTKDIRTLFPQPQSAAIVRYHQSLSSTPYRRLRSLHAHFFRRSAGARRWAWTWYRQVGCWCACSYRRRTHQTAPSPRHVYPYCTEFSQTSRRGWWMLCWNLRSSPPSLQSRRWWFRRRVQSLNIGIDRYIRTCCDCCWGNARSRWDAEFINTWAAASYW